MKSKLNNLISAVFVLALVCSPLATAATRTWDNEGLDNRWDTAANWSGDSIPGTGDVARIVLADADYCLIDELVTATPKKLQVGWGDGTDAFEGKLLMTGGSLAWTAESKVGVKATGVFDFQGGVVNSTHNLFVGDDAGGVGTLLVSGGSFTLQHSSNKRNLKFGLDGAQGTGIISGAIISVNGDILVGQKAGSVGWLSLTDSTVTVGDGFRVGYQQATGTATFSGGTLDIASDFRFGSDGGRGTGTFSGGTISTVSAMDVGRGLGSVGEFTMTDGILNVGTPEKINAMRFGYQGGEGTGTISGGTVNAIGNLVIGNNVAGDPPVGAEGLLTILGGIINVGNEVTNQELSIGKNRGTGTLAMSDGVINVISGDIRIGETTIQTINIGTPEEPVYEEILHPGTGRLTMTGGLISGSDANSLQIGLNDSTGVVDLFGGRIEIGGLEIGAPGSGCTVDFEIGGLLILDGNQMPKVLDYIETGLFTVYGGEVAADWFGWSYGYNNLYPGKTSVAVTEVPEPATIALLGLGGIALIRRKRR